MLTEIENGKFLPPKTTEGGSPTRGTLGCGIGFFGSGATAIGTQILQISFTEYSTTIGFIGYGTAGLLLLTGVVLAASQPRVSDSSSKGQQRSYAPDY